MGEELKVRKKKVGGLKVSSESDYHSLLISSKVSHLLSSKTGDDLFWLFLSQISLFCVLNLVLSWLAVNVGTSRGLTFQIGAIVPLALPSAAAARMMVY